MKYKWNIHVLLISDKYFSRCIPYLTDHGIIFKEQTFLCDAFDGQRYLVAKDNDVVDFPESSGFRTVLGGLAGSGAASAAQASSGSIGGSIGGGLLPFSIGGSLSGSQASAASGAAGGSVLGLLG